MPRRISWEGANEDPAKAFSGEAFVFGPLMSIVYFEVGISVVFSGRLGTGKVRGNGGGGDGGKGRN